MTSALPAASAVASSADASNTPIGSFDLLATGGGHNPGGGFAWGFNGFYSAAGDISRVDITIASNDFVTFDDLRFSAGSSSTPVPEAGTLVMLASGLAGLLGRRRKTASF